MSCFLGPWSYARSRMRPDTAHPAHRIHPDCVQGAHNRPLKTTYDKAALQGESA